MGEAKITRRGGVAGVEPPTFPQKFAYYEGYENNLITTYVNSAGSPFTNTITKNIDHMLIDMSIGNADTRRWLWTPNLSYSSIKIRFEVVSRVGASSNSLLNILGHNLDANGVPTDVIGNSILTPLPSNGVVNTIGSYEISVSLDGGFSSRQYISVSPALQCCNASVQFKIIEISFDN